MNELKILQERAAQTAAQVERNAAEVEAAEAEVAAIAAELEERKTPRQVGGAPRRMSQQVLQDRELARRRLALAQERLHTAETARSQATEALADGKARAAEINRYAKTAGVPIDLAAAELQQRRRAAGMDSGTTDALKMTPSELAEHLQRHGISP